MAWARRDASWSSADVSYPPGVLYVWHARHFFVGAGAGRETVPSADHLEWHRVPAGGPSVLRYRLHHGNAALVDDRRRYRLRRFGCRTAVVHLARLTVIFLELF